MKDEWTVMTQETGKKLFNTTIICFAWKVATKLLLEPYDDNIDYTAWREKKEREKEKKTWKERAISIE
jgi:hypothetical protein